MFNIYKLKNNNIIHFLYCFFIIDEEINVDTDFPNLKATDIMVMER